MLALLCISAVVAQRELFGVPAPAAPQLPLVTARAPAPLAKAQPEALPPLAPQIQVAASADPRGAEPAAGDSTWTLPAALLASLTSGLLAFGAGVAWARPRRAPSTATGDVELGQLTPAVFAVDGAKPEHFFEYLKFDGAPQFDVVEKTKEYVELARQEGGAPESMYSRDYVLRGPVVGPMTRKDLTTTQAGFELLSAFSEISTNPFGYTQDPENPYRVFFFEKWRAKHTGTLKAGPAEFEATGNVMEGPVHVNAVCWTPEGTVIYESVGNTVDRHEGNTGGKAAVFGLLHTAGLKIPGAPGSLVLRLQQRLGHLLGEGGRSFSREEDIPRWWKSASRGADATDPTFSN